MFLSDIKVQKAKAQEKPYKLRDGDGLFLLIHPNGGKYWRFRYSFGGKEKMLALGTYPAVSLLDARDKRLAARKLVAGGVDPSERKKEDKRLAVYQSANTFKAVAEDWHGRNKSKWSPEHAASLWRRLTLYAFPDIGHRPISSLKTPDLIPLLRKPEAQGSLYAARRLGEVLNVVFRYAVHCGLIDQNPASDLRGVLAPHRATSFPTITATELPQFFEKLEAFDASAQNKIAVKLLALTFLRHGELRQSLWSDIDFEGKEWRIPAERMKMRRPHVVPLSAQAIALLHQLKDAGAGDDYLFPSQRHRKHRYMSPTSVNRMLIRMGYKDKLVAHGFRSLASTILNENSVFSRDVIEAQLAHMDTNKVRATYNRAEYLPERQKMMQWWADYIDGGDLFASGGNVIPLTKAQ